MASKKFFPLTISNYALIFLFIVAVFFIGIGVYAYSSIEHARSNIHTNNRLAANEELSQAINQLTTTVSAISSRISIWDEVFQQLENPAYYSYWRKYRLLNADVLPDYIESAEVFDRYGNALAALPDSLFPARIDVNILKPVLELHGSNISYITYLPIKRGGVTSETEGYLGLRLPFIETLLKLFRFRYIDVLESAGSGDQQLALSNAPQVLHFELKSSPEAETMMKIVKTTVIQLATIVGILCLLFYFLMVYLLGKPLVEISEYIDRLLHASPGSHNGGINALFPVAELEKVRSSLNKYHADLEKAQIDLDEKNRELWILAHHDTLTGMLNRRAFESEWHDSRQLLSRRRVGIGLILFDVNHFKTINDSYGHKVGDEVLKAISACIQKSLRNAEKLYRIGGDEFSTIIIGGTPEDEVELAQRCIDAVEKNDFTSTGIRETVRISCGIAHCQANELEKLNNLLWQADVAVYQAKRPGVTRPVLFNEDMADGTEAMFSSWMSNAVYEAVTHGAGIEIHYQPIIDTSDRQVAYFEALVRISHEGELIPPSHIFPIVTMRQMETQMDRVIITKVQEDLSRQLIPKGSGISINLSAESVAHKDVIEWLMPLTDFTQLFYIVIEVTETSLITQISAAVRNLRILRKLGFKVALDDFGSGYSSLRYLTTMPVDIVKFDISLIQGMMDDRLKTLVQEMAGMLIGLGYELVAEGIETEELLQKVKAAGFHLSQGYLFGEPTRNLTLIDRFTAASASDDSENNH
jgi:diguanylate cyclase (GGDEF)-like protein